MRCCEFYTPSQTDDQNHEGLEGSEHYLFDRFVNNAACSDEEIKGNRPFGACGVARAMNMCSRYSPEAAKIIKHVKSGDTELRLEKVRMTYGIVHFQIIRVAAGNEENLDTFDAHALGKREAFEASLVKMKEAMSELPEGTIEDVPVSVDSGEEFSYILEAANAL